LSQRLSIVFQHETVDGKLEIVPYNLNHKICAHFNVCALTILKKDLGVLVVWYDVSKFWPYFFLHAWTSSNRLAPSTLSKNFVQVQSN